LPQNALEPPDVSLVRALGRFPYPGTPTHVAARPGLPGDHPLIDFLLIDLSHPLAVEFVYRRIDVTRPVIRSCLISWN